MRKILLVHGWSHHKYNQSGCLDAWSDRSRFVEKLSDYFEVSYFNLPGFCGEKEPEHPWRLSNFVEYLDKVIRRERPDIVLGYSFGGAVVLHWKTTSGDQTIQAVLVSPAILRRYEHRSVSTGWLRILLPDRLIALARDFYLISVVRNPYYSKASRVMRETYRNIIGLDLREELVRIQDEIHLIYGEKDTATPSEPVRGFLDLHENSHKLRIIQGGGHNIANTHADELVSLIVNLTQRK